MAPLVNLKPGPAGCRVRLTIEPLGAHAPAGNLFWVTRFQRFRHIRPMGRLHKKEASEEAQIFNKTERTQ